MVGDSRTRECTHRVNDGDGIFRNKLSSVHEILHTEVGSAEPEWIMDAFDFLREVTKLKTKVGPS